jgi:carbamoyl-phosphate synthase small subunit
MITPKLWKETPGVLVLESPTDPNGIAWEGVLMGAEPKHGFCWGEAVFNTSMTGYQEILTDPSYHRQLVCMTQPHIGNTGVNRTDEESDHPHAAALIVRNSPTEPSSWRNEESLDHYLERTGVPGIHSVDTRAITRYLRTRGTVRALLLPRTRRQEAAQLFARLPQVEAQDLILEVTTQQAYTVPAHGAKRYQVSALDFGIKRNLIQELTRLGCEVRVFPANTDAEVLLASHADGIFLSNGPGDPERATYAIQTVQKILGRMPLFGVCMGHQILALALGAKTYKLKFGHRGGNQPVSDLRTGRLEISSHNHGYAVQAQDLPTRVEITHRNLNDDCIEGLRVRTRSGEATAFSVQYHPEAAPGPHDSKNLFFEFTQQMDQWRARSLPVGTTLATSPQVAHTRET